MKMHWIALPLAAPFFCLAACTGSGQADPELTQPEGEAMQQRRERHAAFDVVGITVRASNATAGETIGPLWDRFYAEGIADRIQGRLDNCILGVYSKYESDHNGEYTLMAGCWVKDDAPTPEGLERIRVPAQEYVIVSGMGEMPQVVWETWSKVYKTDIRRAFTADFEVYNPDNPDELEIWLAVK